VEAWRARRGERRALLERQRREVVAALCEDGHSYRAIGGALKVDPKTAWKDVNASGVDTSTPEQTTGLDGKSHPATREPQPEPEPERRGHKGKPWLAPGKPSENTPSEIGRSDEKAAELVGVGRPAVADVKRIQKRAPE
jgi:hypothetical protein